MVLLILSSEEMIIRFNEEKKMNRISTTRTTIREMSDFRNEKENKNSV